MSQPRNVLRGATYLVTRRVLRRHHLLRPDSAITRLILYCLAVSAQRYGIQVHALCAMSTHIHLVVTDEQGVLPRFLQFFHRIVALGTKVLRTWEGPVWDHEKTSVVHLMTRAAVVQKIAYTLANPVAAGLVRRANEWLGAKTLVTEIGKGALRAARPEIYFNEKNHAWPTEATLKLPLPPAIEPEKAEEFRLDIAAEIERAEAASRAVRPDKDVLGAERAAAVSPYKRLTSHEALGARNPTFAIGQGTKDDAESRAVEALRAFRTAYRVALAQWRALARDVLFPPGTWWMRVFHAVGISPETASE